jgi:tetratricopeptide (TPR) repeat protein
MGLRGQGQLRMLKAARPKLFKRRRASHSLWLSVSGLLISGLLVPLTSSARQQPGMQPSLPGGSEGRLSYSSVEVEIRVTDGTPLPGPTYVSIIKNDGKVVATKLAEHGKAHFGEVPKAMLTAQVVASGFDTATKRFEIREENEVKVSVDLRPMSDREAAATDRGIAALNPKAQKSVGKALEEMRANKLGAAQTDLTAAQRYAPDSADIEYLMGLCASRSNDAASAKAHWTRALTLNPNHLSTLLALSQNLLHARDTAQANIYLRRALDAEPTAWRSHMLLAQADLLDRRNDEAVTEAERAIELGHDAATSVQPLLAHALFETGEKERANQILQTYIKAHPKDENAAHLYERLNAPRTVSTSTGQHSTVNVSESDVEAAEPLPPNWLPPDIDEKVPPVEPGAACVAADVVQKAGEQLVTLIHDVDRFTATETMTHESVNKFGIAALPEKRKFDYLVSIQSSLAGPLSVSEYRNGGGTQSQFPDGIATNGLPALVLIFHPYYATNYDMVCEGLARTSRGLAWQIHFRQLPDKTNGIKSYQFGMNGPNYQVKLKGRAWISADNYDILRLESDIVAPIPQIRLMADHTNIEYGPITFREANTTLWLPQSAEVYFAWLGRRIHRRHEFSNYLLFGIDDQQHIGDPKTETAGQREPQRKSPLIPKTER